MKGLAWHRLESAAVDDIGSEAASTFFLHARCPSASCTLCQCSSLSALLQASCLGLAQRCRQVVAHCWPQQLELEGIVADTNPTHVVEHGLFTRSGEQVRPLEHRNEPGQALKPMPAANVADGAIRRAVISLVKACAMWWVGLPSRMNRMCDLQEALAYGWPAQGSACVHGGCVIEASSADAGRAQCFPSS